MNKFYSISRNNGTSASSNRKHLAVDERDNYDETDVESEDYYDGIPTFAIQDTADPFKCKCVDCEEDELCGGLWKGIKYPGDYDTNATKVHIVVSHCMNDLDWLGDYLKGTVVASIHVISKCGHPVRCAPEATTIEVLPNVGRCDHTYA